MGYITFENVTKTYGNKRAVDNLSMTIEDGRIFSFLGPNGAGKTTSIKLMTGIIAPTEGRVLIDGHDLRDMQLTSMRKQMSVMMQDTFIFSGTIMENIRHATSDNICFYMAINQINKDTVQDVCIAARDTKNVRAVSFNFHTPYPDTAELALSPEEKATCCEVIVDMMKQGAPVFNLKSAFPYLIHNTFPTPCHQCVVMENGKLSTCGRCIDIPELCKQCGYFFVAEYTLLFRGNPKIIFEMLKTYLKYI